MSKITKNTIKAMIKRMAKGDEVTFTMYPSKANPNSYWFSGYEVTITKENETTSELLETLEKLINNFRYYNCNREMGELVHFYLRTKLQ